MTQQHASEQAAPLAMVAQELRERIRRSRQSVGLQVDSVTRCLHTHRQHTVLWKALRPARHMLTQKDSLPKALWMSTVGAYFIDALAHMVNFDQDVHTQRNAIASLNADLLLLEKLEANGSPQDADALKAMSEHLDDQLLVSFRQEVLAQLQTLLRDQDASIATQREALRDVLVGFIEEQIEMAATEAGYHVVPDMKSMHAGDMLRQSQALIEEIKARLAEPQTARFGFSRREHALISINLNRALALALLSFPHFAKTKAQHLPGSTIDGRINFLKACVGALEQEPAADGAPFDAVNYRMQHAYTRMLTEVNRRIEQFQRDLERASRNVEESANLVGEAQTLQLAVAAIRVRP